MLSLVPRQHTAPICPFADVSPALGPFASSVLGQNQSVTCVQKQNMKSVMAYAYEQFNLVMHMSSSTWVSIDKIDR